MRRGLVLGFFAASALIACQEYTKTQAVLRVTTDLAPGTFDAYWVVVSDRAGAVIAFASLPPSVGGLPTEMGVVPSEEEIAREMIVRVAAVKGAAREEVAFGVLTIDGLPPRQVSHYVVFVGAGTDGGVDDGGVDASSDADRDAEVDAAADAEPDAEADAASDGSVDGAVDGASDASDDASNDASDDASLEGAADAAPDAEVSSDADGGVGPVDANDTLDAGSAGADGGRFDAGIEPGVLIHFGGTGHAEITAMADHPGGGIVAAGWYEGELRERGVAFNSTGLGDRNAFIFAYDNAGLLRWAHSIDGPGSTLQEATAVAVDPIGNVAVLLTLDRCDGFRIDLTTYQGIGPCVNDPDVALISFFDNGNFRAHMIFGSVAADTSAAILFDVFRARWIVSGTTRAALPGPLCTQAAFGQADSFVAAISDSTFLCQWIATAAGAGNDVAGRGALALSGDRVFWGGSISENAIVRGGTVAISLSHTSTNAGQLDAFVASVAADGGTARNAVSLANASGAASVETLLADPLSNGVVAAGNFTRHGGRFRIQRTGSAAFLAAFGANQVMLYSRFDDGLGLLAIEPFVDRGGLMSVADLVFAPRVVFAGAIDGTVQLPRALANFSPIGPSDGIVAGVDVLTQTFVTRGIRIPGDGLDRATALARLASGELAVAGSFDLDISAAVAPWGSTVVNQGGLDALIYIYSGP